MIILDIAINCNFSDANKEVCHTKDQIIKKRHSVDDGFEEHELEHVSGYQDESDNIMYPQRSLEPEHSDYKRNKNDETQEQRYYIHFCILAVS